MNKAIKAASSIGSVALLLGASSVAFAALPVNVFDNWTANQTNANDAIVIDLDYGGGATDTCPANFTCGAAITGDGFMQRMITDDSNGDSYFQTIVTEAGTGRNLQAVDGAPSNLLFADESFVRTGNVDGIADKQQLNDTSTSGNGQAVFKISSELSTGWARGGAGADLKLYQLIKDTKNEGFRTDFWFKQEANENNQAMRITSRVGFNGTFEDGNNAASVTDFQDFVLVEKKGNPFQGLSGSIYVPGVTGGTLSYVAGDDIKATWVGQDLQDTIGQTFDFEGYDNVSTAAYDLISTYSLSHTVVKPVHWTTAVWGDDSTTNEPTWFQ